MELDILLVWVYGINILKSGWTGPRDRRSMKQFVGIIEIIALAAIVVALVAIQASPPTKFGGQKQVVQAVSHTDQAVVAGSVAPMFTSERIATQYSVIDDVHGRNTSTRTSAPASPPEASGKHYTYKSTSRIVVDGAHKTGIRGTAAILPERQFVGIVRRT